MSRPAVGTPLSPIGQTAALSLQLTLRPLNISMFQVGAGTVCVSVSCHSVECSLCNSCLVSIVSRCLPWCAHAGFGTACSSASWEEQCLQKWGVSGDFSLFCWSGVSLLEYHVFQGLLVARELDVSYVGLDLSLSCTSIILLILEELVAIPSDQWAIICIVMVGTCFSLEPVYCSFFYYYFIIIKSKWGYFTYFVQWHGVLTEPCRSARTCVHQDALSIKGNICLDVSCSLWDHLSCSLIGKDVCP